MTPPAGALGLPGAVYAGIVPGIAGGLSAGSGALAAATRGVPVELDRDEAARRARRELAEPAYHQDDPSVLERAISWVLRQAGDLLDRAASASPGGWLGLIVLFVLLVAAAIVIRWRLGPLARQARSDQGVFAVQVRLGSADHRRLAEEAERSGDLRTAVTERFRAVARTLEERGTIDERPGRTADEVAREAGRALPDSATALLGAARDFDDVRYGGRTPSVAAVDRLRALDDRLRRARIPETSP